MEDLVVWSSGCVIDMNTIFVSKSPQIAFLFMEKNNELFKQFTKNKQCIEETSTVYYHYNNIYHFFLSSHMNVAEVDDFHDIFEAIVNLQCVFDFEIKKIFILSIHNKLNNRVSLILKHYIEKYSKSCVFVFIVQQSRHLIDAIVNSCIIVHPKFDLHATSKNMIQTIRPDLIGHQEELIRLAKYDIINLDLLLRKHHNPLDFKLDLELFLLNFFKNKNLSVKETCFKLSASGICFSALSLIILDIFKNDPRVVEELAFSDHLSIQTNKQVLVFIYCLDKIRSLDRS